LENWCKLLEKCGTMNRALSSRATKLAEDLM